MATDQATLVQSLRHPAVFGPEAEPVTVIETHISYVLLTGPYAYKSRRRSISVPELRLSTHGATTAGKASAQPPRWPRPSIDVVTITGTVEAPAISGDGPPRIRGQDATVPSGCAPVGDARPRNLGQDSYRRAGGHSGVVS
jgi:hypothetical protein